MEDGDIVLGEFLDPPLHRLHLTKDKQGLYITCDNCDNWWYLDETSPLEGQDECSECGDKQYAKYREYLKRREQEKGRVPTGRFGG